MLDIAIGLSFVYLLMSIICSAASEGVEAILKNRATDLERGIHELLDEANGGLATTLYGHQLINGLFRGDYEVGGKKLPSYIPARNFALALMDIVLPAQAGRPSGAAGTTPRARVTPQTVVTASAVSATPPAAPPPVTPPANPLDPLRAAAAALPSAKVGQALLTMIDAAGADAHRARENIEAWYNSSMDRVSGWYKRRAQFFIFVCAAIFAVALNVDSVSIVKVLSVDRSLRERLADDSVKYVESAPAAGAGPTVAPTPAPASPAASPESVKTQAATASPDQVQPCQSSPQGPTCQYERALAELGKTGLPIGWTTEKLPVAPWVNLSDSVAQGWALLQVHFFGWLITALAASLGAPFWFDLLNKFVAIRGSTKPPPPPAPVPASAPGAS
jgi:hypothetical protein